MDGSGMNQRAVSFQFGQTEGQSEVNMMEDLQRLNRTKSLNFSGSSGSSSVESVPETKHRPGLDGEWSVEEQYKLEQALVKYADESGMIKYVKIASTLRNKTVRDVAIRCRWMATKRRKHEERSLWKKSKDNKRIINATLIIEHLILIQDKLMESSSNPSVPSIPSINVAPLSVLMNRVRGDGIHVEALRGSVRHLVEQNRQLLDQISLNISALKLLDNVDLIRQMKNNVNAILNDMRFIPGPPLPISVNEDLANTILSIKAQPMMFASSGGMNMKQEPRFW
ncbi:uncharacterized protein LOC143541072 isoform X1 [Bidens hawaiensis]|uniref:uncharacterized protein LOC143541072 isoform X1 n=1 Tax=Bidens hawaiensis TaxID=980011 RepID=UPI0040498E7D